MKNLQHLALIAFLLIYANIVQARAEGNVLLRKPINKPWTLVVSRQQIPYVAPSKDQVKQLQLKSPGSHFATPKRVWLNTLKLHNSKTKREVTLWTRQNQEFTEWTRGLFKVLDVAYDGEVAVVIYREFGAIRGEITRRRNNFAVLPRTQQSLNVLQMFEAPMENRTAFPKNIRISLSRSPERIAVALTDMQGKPRRFLWDPKASKWREIIIAPPAKKTVRQ